MHKRLKYLQYLALKSSRSWLCLLLGLMAAALQAGHDRNPEQEG